MVRSHIYPGGWRSLVPNRYRPALMRVTVVFLCVGLASCGGLSRKKETNPQVYGLNDTVPQGGGRYKVGNPYKIAGSWYRPREDRSYDKIGIASWYGDYFHGRLTANGEYYDMNRLSAAHPTLPLPVYARVTNLENNRSLVVRINDRGPYARNRVIDLSKRAAQELGVIRKGTARVRVKYLTDAPLNGDISNMQALGTQFEAPFNTASIDPPAAKPTNAITKNPRFANRVLGQIPAPVATGSIEPGGWQTTILPPLEISTAPNDGSVDATAPTFESAAGPVNLLSN